MNFDVNTEKLSDEQYVISLAGEVDLYTAPEFKQQLLEVIDQGGRDVVVDLSDLHFADSSLMVDLAVLAQRLRADGRRLRLRGPQPQIQKLIELMGLHRMPAVETGWA